MLITKEYIRERAVEYASRWAFSRNPLFYDYTGIGGNCTNFVSQCVYAGSCTMNFTAIFGWYYLSDKERTASWTGVEFFYNFMTGNKGPGPFGRECTEEELLVGDIIQLGRTEEGYYHTLITVGFAEGVPLVSSQSNDAFGRPLDSYEYDYARYIHIEGVRQAVPDTGDCYESVLAGIAIIPDYTGQTPPAAEEPPSGGETATPAPAENAGNAEGAEGARTTIPAPAEATEGAGTAAPAPAGTAEGAGAATPAPMAENTGTGASAPVTGGAAESAERGETPAPPPAAGATENAGRTGTAVPAPAENAEGVRATAPAPSSGAVGNAPAPTEAEAAVPGTRPGPSAATDLSAGML